MVLIVVLIVVAMLGLTGYTFTRLMFAERRAAQTSVRMAQSRMLAESGLELAKQFAALDSQTQTDLGGWFDNPTQFQGALVVDDDQAPHRGRVTLVAPLLQDGISISVRYGLENESAKLNLRLLQSWLSTPASPPGGPPGTPSSNNETLARSMLMQLPGMTDDIADSILDWLDENDETRNYGAETEYYSGLSPPYAPTNGLPRSIEELLLVKGVTPELLFGPDWNRNGVVDSDEPADGSMEGVDNTDGSMNRGWAAFLTLDSAESVGQKVNLNETDMTKLSEALQQPLGDPNWVAFIVAYRQFGPAPQPNGPPAAIDPSRLDLTTKGTDTGKLTSVLDLVDTTVRISSGQTWNSPFQRAALETYLPKLLENCYCSSDYPPDTESSSTSIPGRVNINQAPRAVLRSLLAIQSTPTNPPGAASTPVITEEIIDRIISERIENPTTDTADHQYVTWIYSKGIVTWEQMKALMPYVTTGGSVFRATAVGFFEGGGPMARMEAVFDATKSPPTVLLWRDISHLGRGYTLDVLGAAGN